jgi:hypothetical protein
MKSEHGLVPYRLELREIFIIPEVIKLFSLRDSAKRSINFSIMRLVSSFLGVNSELSPRESKSNRVSLLLNTSKSNRKEAFKKKCTADDWIADARDEGSTRVSLSLEPSKSRKAAIKKKVGTKELIAEDAREDAHVVGSECGDAERQDGEEFPAIYVGPYEEMLAGSGSFPFTSRRVRVNRLNDQKRRYGKWLMKELRV